jgi:hypothetical protein
MINSQNLTLHFMPWCRLDREYSVGPVALIPFSRDHPPANLEPNVNRAVNAILADFMAVDGRLVTRCVLVSLEGRVFVEGVETGAAFETIYDYVQIACLSSLEGREYLGRAEPYSNSECFALIARQYRDGAAVAPPILRRDSTPMGLGGDALRVHMPVQTVVVPRSILNEPLYCALAELRRRMMEDERVDSWAVWAESIYSFNLANTDSEGISGHMEWVLMSSSIERLLRARPSAPDVAQKVVAALLSHDSPNTFAGEVVHDWAKEFYRLRNDFAHGKMRSRQPRTWNSASHLLLGAIAFPLLVKNLLEREGVYRPTENDLFEVAAFARLAADLRDSGPQLASWHQYVREQRGEPA